MMRPQQCFYDVGHGQGRRDCRGAAAPIVGKRSVPSIRSEWKTQNPFRSSSLLFSFSVSCCEATNAHANWRLSAAWRLLLILPQHPCRGKPYSSACCWLA
jgi:hypothetical protein